VFRAGIEDGDRGGRSCRHDGAGRWRSRPLAAHPTVFDPGKPTRGGGRRASTRASSCFAAAASMTAQVCRAGRIRSEEAFGTCPQIIVDFLNTKFPAYVDTGLNG